MGGSRRRGQGPAPGPLQVRFDSDRVRLQLADNCTCSAANLLEESTVLYDDAWVRGDVHQWTNFRWLPQPPPTRREDDPDDEAELEEHDDGEAQERAGSPTAPGSWSGVTLEGHPDVEPCFEAVEQSSLRILRCVGPRSCLSQRTC